MSSTATPAPNAAFNHDTERVELLPEERDVAAALERMGRLFGELMTAVMILSDAMRADPDQFEEDCLRRISESVRVHTVRIRADAIAHGVLREHNGEYVEGDMFYKAVQVVYNSKAEQEAGS